MCGIIGMVGVSAVNQRIYDALTVLQHRGQDAAGIMTSVDGELFMRKDSGLVRDVFQQKHMLKLKGNIGIGHVRYPTAGAESANDAQPFYVNSPYGICLGHNGNLTNSRELTEVLVREDRRHLNTGSDSEVLLNVLASELQRVGTPRVTPADIFAAANAVYRRCRGGAAGVGYLLKDRVADVGEFVEALSRVAAGGTALDPEVVTQLLGASRRTDGLGSLTARERDVLALMAEGRSNGAIAGILVVSERAVEKHVGNIFSKLGLPPSDADHRRVLAVLRYLES